MLNKKLIIVISLVILILGFFLTLPYNMENEIRESGGLILDADDFSNGYYNLSVRILKNDDPKIDTYSTTVDGDTLRTVEGNSLHIIIFRLNAQAMAVYFNGELLDTYGDIENAHSHIYNSLASFTVSKDKIRDTNIISIKVNSLYMVGLEKNPIGIVNPDTSRYITESIETRTQSLTLIGIGIFILGMLITIMLIYLGDKKNMGLLYFLLSIVFLSIYSLDFMNFTQMAFSFIVFKKIIIFSLFACIFFLGLSFSKMFKSKSSWIFSTFLFFIISIVVLFVNNIILFKRIYDILIPLISINFILWIVIAAKNLKEKDEAIIFLCSFINLLILSLADGVQLVIFGGTVSASIVSHVLIFSFILVLLLYLEINRRNITIENETRQHSHFYKQAISDHLTGVFNLKYTVDILASETSPYTLVMLDIDDFKNINDRFGHQGGDFMLKYLVKKMKDEFRDTDLIGRYGGDEFIVILRGCSEKNAFEIMNRFRMHIEHDRLKYGNSVMNTTISIGIAYCTIPNGDTNTIIKQADEALYRAKHNGKNQVSI
ncbi:MAG: diguanylate cyclase [Clostridiales bacterium]|nr:diguanylate cyclase [Clostridiales bacterium]